MTKSKNRYYPSKCISVSLHKAELIYGTIAGMGRSGARNIGRQLRQVTVMLKSAVALTRTVLRCVLRWVLSDEVDAE